MYGAEQHGSVQFNHVTFISFYILLCTGPRHRIWCHQNLIKIIKLTRVHVRTFIYVKLLWVFSIPLRQYFKGKIFVVIILTNGNVYDRTPPIFYFYGLGRIFCGCIDFFLRPNKKILSFPVTLRAHHATCTGGLKNQYIRKKSGLIRKNLKKIKNRGSPDMSKQISLWCYR